MARPGLSPLGTGYCRVESTCGEQFGVSLLLLLLVFHDGHTSEPSPVRFLLPKMLWKHGTERVLPQRPGFMER